MPRILSQVQNFSVPPQEMITKDSVTVYVNAIMYYKVFANIKTILKSIRCNQHQDQPTGGRPGEGRDQCRRLQRLCPGSCCNHIEESVVVLVVVVVLVSLVVLVVVLVVVVLVVVVVVGGGAVGIVVVSLLCVRGLYSNILL